MGKGAIIRTPSDRYFSELKKKGKIIRDAKVDKELIDTAKTTHCRCVLS